MKQVIIAVFLFCSGLTGAQAVPVNIGSMDISSANIAGNFLPPGGLTLSPTATTNLVGGYINSPDAIIITSLMGDDQIIYTAASNLAPNGNPMAPAVGSIAGGPAPTGTLDNVAGTINMDLSSWMVNHFGMDQNLGSASAAGSWDPVTQLYTLSWVATLTQGPNGGQDVTWTLAGSASPVPVPAAVWLFGSGLLGLAGVVRRKK